MSFEKEKLLGLRIKALRKHFNLTQEKFAEKVEIDTRTLSDIETGKRLPSFGTLFSILYKFDIEPNYLLDFIAPKYPIENVKDQLILEHLKNLSTNSKCKIIELLESLHN